MEINTLDLKTSLNSLLRITNQAEDGLCFKLKNGIVAPVSVVNTSYQSNTVMFIFDQVHWKHRMNSTDTTAGGWASSEMAEYLNTEVLALLPDELVEMIQPRTIRQKVNGRVYEWTGKLWLPSQTEVFGGENDCDIDEARLPFFERRKNRIAVDDNDSLCWWWLRTVVLSQTFAHVLSSGNACDDMADYALGVRPCFFVRLGV